MCVPKQDPVQFLAVFDLLGLVPIALIAVLFATHEDHELTYLVSPALIHKMRVEDIQ